MAKSMAQTCRIEQEKEKNNVTTSHPSFTNGISILPSPKLCEYTYDYQGSSLRVSPIGLNQSL